MKRKLMTLAIGAVAMVGCQDMGLEGNVPLAEAEQAPPTELMVAVYETDVALQELIVDGRLWVPDGLPWTVSESALRTVGSAAGETVYARSWDQRPYDALFTRLPEAEPELTGMVRLEQGPRWQSYAPVLGGGGPAGGSATPEGAHGSDAGH